METPGHSRDSCLCSTQTCLAQTLPRSEFWCPQVFPTCSGSMFSLCSGYVWSSGFCSGLPLSINPSFLVRIPRISVSNAKFRAFESCLLHPGLDSMGFPGVLLSLMFSGNVDSYVDGRQPQILDSSATDIFQGASIQ